jgi:tetratricopeptide (TPR) repeat protein
METEERQELKQNDLREFLLNFREWWGQYGNSVLLVVAVVCLAVAGYFFYTNQQRARINEAWRDLATSTSPDALVSVAETHRLDAVQALAWLRGADLYLQQAITPGQGDQPRPQLLDQAATAYQRVSGGDYNSVYRANALLGLGSVAEARQQWDQAEEHYTRAAQLAEEQALPALAGQAHRRQQMLARLAQPVTLAETPEQPQMPAGMPGMGPGGGMPGMGGPGAGEGAPAPGAQPMPAPDETEGEPAPAGELDVPGVPAEDEQTTDDEPAPETEQQSDSTDQAEAEPADETGQQ